MNLIIKVKNFNYIISSINFDIVHSEKIFFDEKIFQSSELTFEENGNTTKIKFELAKGNEINKDDFLFIPETNTLFYSGNIEWCAFDLTNKMIVRNESATQSPFIERRKDIILIYDDLFVECTDLKGNMIDNVPVDPPTESIYFEDSIEFNSPVFGKRTLRLKTN
jgi:hypothetical protein